MKGENFFRDWSCFFMDLTIQEKGKLIEFFQFLLNREIDKPLGEMNSEAVDNYIKILLHLQDNHIELSSEFINEQVRKIFPKEDTTTVIPDTVKTKKNYFNKKKVWLVAACIAILVALFSVISFSSERSVKDILEEYLGTFEFISSGEEIDVGNESYGKDGEIKEYKSIEDLIETEKINLLFPSYMMDNITGITSTKVNDKDEIRIVFDMDLFMSITLNSGLSDETTNFCNKKITLNGNDCHLCIMEDVNQAQAYFIHDNNLYAIDHTNEDELIEMLKNMEIIKYEN